VDQADEYWRTLLNHQPLFRFDVRALSNRFPSRIHRLPILNMALRHIAILAFSINMVKPEVIYPSVVE